MSEKNERVLNMLAKAMEMEKKGKDYYDKAVEETKNEMGKKIFEMLGQDEVLHQQRIKEIYDKISQGNSFPEEEVEKIENEYKPNRLKQLFVDIAKSNKPKIKADPSDVEAIKMGIEFEETAVRYYKDHLPEAEDEMEKRFINEMIIEEKSHHKALTEMHYYLTDPEAWMMERERVGLDGA